MPTNRTASAAHIRWRNRVLARDKSRGVTHCPLCGIELSWGKPGLPTSVEADHIVPVRLGGQNTLDNGQAICRTCNRSKGDRLGPKVSVENQTISNVISW